MAGLSPPPGQFEALGRSVDACCSPRGFECEGSLLAVLTLSEDLALESVAVADPRAAALDAADGTSVPARMAAVLGTDERDLMLTLGPLLSAKTDGAAELSGGGGRGFLFRIVTRRDPSGEACGMLLTIHDHTPAGAATADAHLLNEIVSRLPEPFVAIDAEGIVREWNPGAERVYGYARQEVVGQVPFLDMVHPGDRAAVAEHLRAIRLESRTEPLQSRRLHKDGRPVDVLCEGVAVRGDAHRSLCILEVDVTERGERERRREFIVREMDHRVKNTLAAVQAIAEGSLRSSGGSFADFKAALRSRLSAYASAHRALWANDWAALSIRQLFEMVLAPYGRERVSFPDAVDLAVPGSAVLPLTMTVHELASNAVRHGALSVPEGRVSVGWSLDESSGRLGVRWRESGGPTVKEHRKKGFGLAMIRDALPFQTGADVTVRMPPEGVDCVISIPVTGDSGAEDYATS